MSTHKQYSLLDKILHNIAFSSWSAQAAFSDIEDLFFKTQINNTTIKEPVFISGLPRSGTTLLLNLCYESNEFASHTYRNMPFIMC